MMRLDKDKKWITLNKKINSDFIVFDIPYYKFVINKLIKYFVQKIRIYRVYRAQQPPISPLDPPTPMKTFMTN